METHALDLGYPPVLFCASFLTLPSSSSPTLGNKLLLFRAE